MAVRLALIAMVSTFLGTFTCHVDLLLMRIRVAEHRLLGCQRRDGLGVDLSSEEICRDGDTRRNQNIAIYFKAEI